MDESGEEGAGPGNDHESVPAHGEPDPDDSRVFVSARARRGAIARVLGLGVLVVVLSVAVRVAAPNVADPAWIRARIAGLGPLAPAAFVALQTAQVVLAPIPGQTLAGVGGYLFGTGRGTALSMIGVALGSSVVFLGTRRFGRRYVERVVEADALARWDATVDRVGVPGLFVLFLLPTFPDDLLCVVAGLTEVRFGTFLGLVVVGRTPTFLLAAYAGTRLAEGRFVAFGLVLAGVATVSVAVYAARHRVPGLLDVG